MGGCPATGFGASAALGRWRRSGLRRRQIRRERKCRICTKSDERTYRLDLVSCYSFSAPYASSPRRRWSPLAAMAHQRAAPARACTWCRAAGRTWRRWRTSAAWAMVCTAPGERRMPIRPHLGTPRFSDTRWGHAMAFLRSISGLNGNDLKCFEISRSNTKRELLHLCSLIGRSGNVVSSQVANLKLVAESVRLLCNNESERGAEVKAFSGNGIQPQKMLENVNLQEADADIAVTLTLTKYAIGWHG